MVNVNKLKGKIAERDMSILAFADKIGMQRSTLYRRLNAKGCDFSIAEADTIVKILGLNENDSTAIFFSQFVAETQHGI